MINIKKKFKYEFKSKVLLTSFFIFIYILGANIPLPGISSKIIISNNFSFLTFTGFKNNGSFFSLGISPFITASIFINFLQMANANKTSKKTTNKISAILGTVIAIFQAYFYVNSNSELSTFDYLFDIIALIVGATVVMFMALYNDEHGIGKITIFIIINVLAGQISNVTNFLISVSENNFFIYTIAVILVYLLVIIIYVTIDRTELRIPHLQLNIKSEYHNKTYFPIKLNCTNVTPIMFTSGIFSILIISISSTVKIFVTDKNMLEELSIILNNDYFNLIMYSVLLMVFCIFMAFIMINPTKISEDMKKNNENLCYLYPGKDTKKYLTKCVGIMSTLNGCIFILAICGPILFFIQFGYGFNFGFQISSIFFMIGMFVKLVEELKFEYKLFTYKGIFN